MGNEELVLEQALAHTDTLPDENFGTVEASVEDLPKVEVHTNIDGDIIAATKTEIKNINQLEQDEIDKILDAVPDVKPAPEDYASAYIERHLAAAKGLLKQLGGNAVERVFLNVMAGEFSRKEYNPVTENERALAHHFNECVNLRAKIVFSQEFERLAEAFAKEEEDLKKIDQLTQDALTPEAKQMLAEAGDKVEIKVQE